MVVTATSLSLKLKNATEENINCKWIRPTSVCYFGGILIGPRDVLPLGGQANGSEAGGERSVLVNRPRPARCFEFGSLNELIGETGVASPPQISKPNAPGRSTPFLFHPTFRTVSQSLNTTWRDIGGGGVGTLLDMMTTR